MSEIVTNVYQYRLFISMAVIDNRKTKARLEIFNDSWGKREDGGGRELRKRQWQGMRGRAT